MILVLFKQGFKQDVPLWDRMHEGASGISQCTRPWRIRVPGISQFTAHHTKIILWRELFRFDTLQNQNLQSRFWRGRWRTKHCRKSIHGFVGHVHNNPCDVIIIPVSPNLHKIWTQICVNGQYFDVSFINHASIIFNEINDVWNTNCSQLC